MKLGSIKGVHPTGREMKQEFSGGSADICCPLRALGKMEHSVGMLKSGNPRYVLNGVEQCADH